MSRLLIMLSAALVFAAFIDSRDRELFRRWNGRKEIRITLLLGIVLSLFCGMRVWGNDTVTYLQMYEQIPLIHQWEIKDLPPLAEGVGFSLIATMKSPITGGDGNVEYLAHFVKN